MAYQPNQHRIALHGRELHFVAYEGTPANERRGEPAAPPMWYLMSEGRRHPVMPHLADQSPAEVDHALRQWAEANAFGAVAPRTARAALDRHTADLKRHDWWSPD